MPQAPPGQVVHPSVCMPIHKTMVSPAHQRSGKIWPLLIVCSALELETHGHAGKDAWAGGKLDREGGGGGHMSPPNPGGGGGGTKKGLFCMVTL